MHKYFIVNQRTICATFNLSPFKCPEITWCPK